MFKRPSHHTTPEAPTDATRRTLLLGLPGGLALASPLALVACGGGGNDSAAAAVVLPQGVDPARVTVVGRAGEMSANQDDPVGHASADDLGLVAAVHDGERLIALGLMSRQGAQRALDARSSAQALLFMALGGTALGPADRLKLLEALDKDPQVTSLTSTLQGLWATDPFVLDGPDSRVVQAVQSAVGLIAAARTPPAQLASRARPLGAAPALQPMQRIEPSNEVSGVTVLQADGSDGAPGFRIQNTKRRQGVAHVYEVGYTPMDGAPFAHALAQTQYEQIEVPSTQSLSVFSAISDIISGTAPWSPVETPRFGLPMHGGAERTEYELVYVTPVYDRPEPAFFQEVRYSLLRETWREELRRMYQTAQMSLVFGAVLEALGLGGAVANENALAAAITALEAEPTPGMIELLRRSGMGEALLPGIRAWLISVSEGTALVSGAYRVGVATLVERADAALAANLRAGTLSRARLTLFHGSIRVMLAVSFVAGVFDTAAQYRDLHSGEKAHLVKSTLVAPRVQVSPSSGKLGKGKEMVLTARVSGTHPNTTLTSRWTLTGSSLATLQNSTGVTSPSTVDSDDLRVTLATTPSTVGTLTVEVEVFMVEGTTRRSLGSAKASIEMSDTTVTLSPASATIERTNGSQAFTAVVTAPPVDAAQIQYEWRCASAFGTLRTGEMVTSAAAPTFVTPSPNTQYAGGPGLNGGEIETVTVVAFHFDDSGNRIDLGSASADVTVRARFSLELLPSLGDVPTDSPIALTAHVRETLPAGSTVEWFWGHVGVGSFTSGAPSIDAASAIGRLDTGPTEGAATVTVSAIVRTPANGPEAGQIVVTKLVSRTLNVKKGLREITFEASGGAFACSDPKACGVSFYGAYLVPRMPKAVGYRAVFTGFGYGPCNRTLSWTAPVRDGGGCNFPVTYHPHSSSGPTDMWAVWLGFSDTWNPGGGKCMVTITLAP